MTGPMSKSASSISQRGTWHMPETKNQRDHTIHLSEFARAQFKQLEVTTSARAQHRVTEPMGVS